MVCIKTHRLIFLFLTIALLLTGGMFNIEGYEDVIVHPQFGHFEKFGAIKALIEKGSSGLFWYSSFFAIDFLWAASLLTLVYRYMRMPAAWLSSNPLRAGILSTSFFLTASLAYLFDCVENFLYLFYEQKKDWENPLATIVDIKMIMYGLSALLFVVFCYQKYVFEKLDAIKKSVKASLVSLVIIGLLVGLSTLMDQGSTVIIHLLESPWSLAGTIILLNMLAMASAHYPDYLDKYFSRSLSVKWNLYPMIGHKAFLGMGLITYTQTPEFTNYGDISTAVQRQIGSPDTKLFDHFRKITGMLVMITWLYVLLYVFQKYRMESLASGPILCLLMVLFLVFYFLSFKTKQYWRRHVTNNVKKIQSVSRSSNAQEEMMIEEEAVPPSVVAYAKATLISFLLLIIATGGTIYLAYTASWTVTWGALLVTTLINTVFIILFQHFRTIINLINLPSIYTWNPIVHLGNDLTFVRFFALMGFSAFIVFTASTFAPAQVNALVLILLFVYLLYGFIVTMLKHHLYHSTPDKDRNEANAYPLAKIFFEKYVPILGLMLLIWILFNGKAGNGLHVLNPKTESPTLVTLDTFVDQLKLNLAEEHGKGSYFIASYGGGLRATAWTMLLLDTLEKADPAFFDQTIAMSGVSGGFLGLSLYTAIRTEHTNPKVRYEKIETIGKHNLLSIDISYLLGLDFIRELIPFKKKFCFRDRAGRSMETYASLIQPDNTLCDSMVNASYRAYWSGAYQQSLHNHFPALIGNTTGTNGRYGVAFSLPYSAEDKLFPGAIDILQVSDTSSISYLDATSTTERFPIFSPLAQIDGKGDFLDGGYFENSGLLSLMNFYEFLQRDTSLHTLDSNSKIIVIINSKEAYIRKVLGDSIKTSKDLAVSEIGAILKTVGDVSILPSALEEKYQQQFGSEYIPVYLPYPITYEDVINQLRGIPADPLLIQRLITASNKKITTALLVAEEKHSYPIPPALARVLSDPAYEYIKAMLGHEEVKEQITRIRN